jgi:hypothetical protein
VRLLQTAIAVDQTVNAILNGWADETLSARCYRQRMNGKWMYRWYRFINALFFWQDDHCKDSYLSEVDRNQISPEYRDV